MKIVLYKQYVQFPFWGYHMSCIFFNIWFDNPINFVYLFISRIIWVQVNWFLISLITGLYLCAILAQWCPHFFSGAAYLQQNKRSETTRFFFYQINRFTLKFFLSELYNWPLSVVLWTGKITVGWSNFFPRQGWWRYDKTRFHGGVQTFNSLQTCITLNVLAYKEKKILGMSKEDILFL